TLGAGVAGEVVKGLGDASAGTATVYSGATDFSDAITKIKNSDTSAVYFSGYSSPIGEFVKQLRAWKRDLTVVAGDRVFTDTFITNAGKDAAEGVYITCTCVPPPQAGN